MKNNFNYILIFLFFTQLSFSQKIVDLKADYYIIERGELFLYEKSGEVFNEISLYIEPDGNGIQKIIDEKQEILNNEIPKEVNRIDLLETVSYKKILDSLESKIFTENTYGKKELNTLELYNDFFFKITTFLLEDKHHSTAKENSQIWDFYDRQFASYFVIKLNGEKTIIVFVENAEVPDKWGYIIPLPKQLKIIWDRDYHFVLESNSQISKDSLYNLNNQIIYYQNLNLPFKIQNNVLYDIALQQKLLTKEFENVKIIENNFIVGSKDTNLTVYSLKLKEITPKNLRAIFPPIYDIKYAQILVGNEIKWLDYEGNFIDYWKGGRYIDIGENDYKLKIKNLMSSPIVKKYKNIEKFVDNFARFELYNGKKGWVDLKGKEYFDK